MTTIHVHKGQLLFPHVYEPDDRFDGNRHFSVVVPGHFVEDVDLLGVRTWRRNGTEHVRVSSKRRPEIKVFCAGGTPGPGRPIDRLIDALLELDAMNTPRDRVFEDKRTAVDVVPCEYYTGPHLGKDVMLLLCGVTIYI